MVLPALNRNHNRHRSTIVIILNWSFNQPSAIPILAMFGFDMGSHANCLAAGQIMIKNIWFLGNSPNWANLGQAFLLTVVDSGEQSLCLRMDSQTALFRRQPIGNWPSEAGLLLFTLIDAMAPLKL